MRKLLPLLFLLVGSSAWGATTNIMSYSVAPTTWNQINISSSVSSAFNGATASQSDIQDNTGAAKYLDVLVGCQWKSGGAGIVSTGSIVTYAFGNISNYQSDNVGVSSATVTLTNPPNLRPVNVCNIVATSTQYNCGPFSIAQAFGGILPDKWGIVNANYSGGTMANGACFFLGINTDHQ